MESITTNDSYDTSRTTQRDEANGTGLQSAEWMPA